QQVKEALEEARTQNPELAGFYELHQKVFRLQHEAKAKIAATLEMLDQEVLRARVLQGLPQLSFAQLPLEAEDFSRLATEITQALLQYNPELAVGTDGFEEIDWLSLAGKRFERGMANEGQEEAPEEAEMGLVETAVDLALQPYLEWAAEQVMPHINQEHWKRGYCPVCGGQPGFALLESEAGARYLLCSRCRSQWLYKRLGCPFCNNTDHTKLLYYPSEDEVYRLYVCQACKHYLKVIDLRQATHKVVLAAEPLLTVAMDLAAQEQGYKAGD
ncbi:MAG: formate dehydrogenase accessory protein FdhE, partial [Anaerolineales bacterium]